MRRARAARSKARPRRDLLADIGGTYSRLALHAGGVLAHVDTCVNADFDGPGALIESYLAGLPAAVRPRRAAIAVAAPVAGDHVRLTNLDWSFSIRALRMCLGLQVLTVINDFTAVALAVPRLRSGAVVKIGAGRPQRDRAVGVIGPGTGLGVSGLLPRGGGWIPLPGEGGHATLAAASTEECAILEWFRGRYGHVSAERVLCGSGLVDLYQCLAPQRAEGPVTPEYITELAVNHADPLARCVYDAFFAFLGIAAGNLALTLGARGGIYLAGGILPRVLDLLKNSPFRERFEAKGRFRAYLEAIPTGVIVDPHPALKGLAACLTPAA